MKMSERMSSENISDYWNRVYEEQNRHTDYYQNSIKEVKKMNELSTQVRVDSTYDRIIEVARAKDFSQDVFLLGTGWKMVDHPQYINGWAVYPLHLFHRHIPKEGLDHICILRARGTEMIGVVVLDDPNKYPIPPKLLPPTKPHPRYNVPHIELPPINWRFVFVTTFKILLGMVAAVAAVVVGIFLLAAIIAVAVVAGVAIITLGALGTILAYDPVLAIITPSGDLIAVYSWDD
jgi:hypothetical protein